MSEEVFKRSTLERLGKRLRDEECAESKDLDLLQAYRLSYKDVISEVFHIVDTTAKSVCDSAICAFRIKRIDSIIGKLRRLRGKLELNRMADIAGCRCIVKTEREIYRIIKKLKESDLQVDSTNDYIKAPQDTGYRSVHIYVYLDKYTKNKKVEIQLRTREHHNWATFVETIDSLYNIRIKEDVKELGKENIFDDFLKFHQIMSKSRHSIDDKFFLLNKIVQYDVVGKINTIIIKNVRRVRLEWVKIKYNEAINNPICCYVISTREDAYPEILAFESYDAAECKYYELFSTNRKNANIVLLNMPNATYDQVVTAYSNYLLTGHAFMRRFNRLISDLFNVKSGKTINQLKPFMVYYKAVIDNYNKYMFTEHQLLKESYILPVKHRQEWILDVQNRYSELYRDNESLTKEMTYRMQYEQQSTILGKIVFKIVFSLFGFLK